MLAEKKQPRTSTTTQMYLYVLAFLYFTSILYHRATDSKSLVLIAQNYLPLKIQAMPWPIICSTKS